jgi:hypothetical protein
MYAARPDADERQVRGAVAALHDLVADADEGALDRLPVHHLARAVLAHRHRSWPAPIRARAKKTPPRPCREATSDEPNCEAIIETLPDLAGPS